MVTNYQFPWTASGLELLAKVQGELRRWEGMPDDASTHCSKTDCAFCNYVAPIDEPEHVVVMQSALNDMPHNNYWGEFETDMLLISIGLTTIQLISMFPNRTESAIESRKCILRKKYNIPVRPRTWDKQGFTRNNKYLTK